MEVSERPQTVEATTATDEPQEPETEAEELPVPSVEDGWTFFYCGEG